MSLHKKPTVTEEVVKRFAEAAETIISAKARLSKKLTDVILVNRSAIMSDMGKQNPDAVEKLELAINRISLYQSNVDRSGWFLAPDPKHDLNAQIDYIDDIFREFLWEYASLIHILGILMKLHVLAKLFREKIKNSPKLRSQLNESYREINEFTIDLIDLSEENQLKIESIEKSLKLCLDTEEISNLAPDIENDFTISQLSKMSFTDLLLQYLLRIA